MLRKVVCVRACMRDKIKDLQIKVNVASAEKVGGWELPMTRAAVAAAVGLGRFRFGRSAGSL